MTAGKGAFSEVWTVARGCLRKPVAVAAAPVRGLGPPGVNAATGNHVALEGGQPLLASPARLEPVQPRRWAWTPSIPTVADPALRVARAASRTMLRE